MSSNKIKVTIKHKIDTTANWAKANPVLADGERGIERTTDGLIYEKVGDGKTAWNALPYVPAKIATTATNDGTGKNIANTYTTKSSLAAVATSGKYSDLTGTPTITAPPTKLSQLQNDSGFITKDTADTTYLGVNGKAASAGTADTAAGLTTAMAYGDLTGKTIADFKTLLYTEVKKAPPQGMRLITFSANLGDLVSSWNAGTDTAVIKGGTTNSVLISNAYVSNYYASLEMWSYWKGARYRIQLSNGVWDKWEKVAETFNGILTADRAMADSDGNTLQQTYAKKTDIPTKLPSPNAVTFTGGATGTYDGSKAVTINIPQGMTVNDTAYIGANAPSKPVSIWFKTV